MRERRGERGGSRSAIPPHCPELAEQAPALVPASSPLFTHRFEQLRSPCVRSDYSKGCCFNNVACSEEETLVSEPKYTESTCWSGSH